MAAPARRRSQIFQRGSGIKNIWYSDAGCRSYFARTIATIAIILNLLLSFLYVRALDCISFSGIGSLRLPGQEIRPLRHQRRGASFSWRCYGTGGFTTNEREFSLIRHIVVPMKTKTHPELVSDVLTCSITCLFLQSRLSGTHPDRLPDRQRSMER